MRFFLEIRHWKLFMLFYGFPVIILFSLPTRITTATGSVLTEFISYVAFSAVMGLYFFWLWSIGKYLFAELSIKQIRKSAIMYNICFSILITYLVVLGYIIITPDSQTNEAAWIFPTIVILHLMMMASLVYISVMNAKMLKMVESDNLPDKNWIGDVFLFLFYPIGVWFIQPRVNRLAKNSS